MTFVPGLELNAGFYREVVEPVLGPWTHSAGRLGWGSDVLGFDSERSTDHGWGPQVLVLVDEGSVGPARAAVDRSLPETFQGWPVAYGWDDTPVTHHVVVTTLDRWLSAQLGIDLQEPMTPIDWLVLPQQHLLEVTTGAVFRDDNGDLSRARQALSWYPDDVWRWMLAAQWRRIAHGEAFPARAAEVGDELGARILSARLARDLMRLWFLFSRHYWPYPKWLGTAFNRLPDSAPLADALATLTSATSPEDREDALVTALEIAARGHNEIGLTSPVEPSVRPFHGRPYRVLLADRFVDACLDGVSAPLREFPLVGSIDQVADSADVLDDIGVGQRLRALYPAG